MIRRLNIGHVTEPIYVVEDGQLQVSGERTHYVLVVEQAFDDPAEAQAMFTRIQQRGTILDEEVEWCSGSERWPAGMSSNGRTGVCPTCRSAWSLDSRGRLIRHLPEEPQEERAASATPPPGGWLEIF